MNKSLQKLVGIAGKKERSIVGMMSGTSADGLDIVWCRISGHGKQTRFSIEQFLTMPWPSGLKERLIRQIHTQQVRPLDICVLHTELGKLFGRMLLDAFQKWGIGAEQIDLIASHGHTFYHAPAAGFSGKPFHATMQLADGDHIAHATDLITISDFRQRDTARGRQGAPLAGYADRLLFSSDKATRIMLNMGGIANFSVIKKGPDDSEVLSYDTGPGNTLLDAVVRKYYPGETFDKGGEKASGGKIDHTLLKRLKSHPYFSMKPPRSTGFEVFNIQWVEQCMDEEEVHPAPEDLLATLTRLTVETIAEEIRRAVPVHHPIEVFVSGGGVHNKTMMDGLQRELQPYPVQSLDVLGVSADAKEGLLFAVLANELICGENPECHFGKISFPDK
ncbi:anhydro-N-acetylmuramic acid kinase [Balneolaceae bacterium ANBcel3]|nr:anhydro-N-acetylmuramic acid kinase [Balneolaceae bacterium ANBcel3]